MRTRFPPTYHTRSALFVGLRPFFIIIYFRVTEVSAGLVIYFRTPFAPPLFSSFYFFFLFLLFFFALRLKPCTLLFNKTCSLYGGWRGRACSPETERKSIWPKSTRQPPEFYSRHNHLRPIYRYKRTVADKEREMK